MRGEFGNLTLLALVALDLWAAVWTFDRTRGRYRSTWARLAASLAVGVALLPACAAVFFVLLISGCFGPLVDLH